MFLLNDNQFQIRSQFSTISIFLIYIYFDLKHMLVELKVKNLQANLPLEDSDIFFLLIDENLQGSLPQNLNCQPTDQYVLMSEVSETNIPETNFIIEIENPENQITFELYVLAISSSNSKLLLLGSVKIDFSEYCNSSFLVGKTQTLKKPLLGVTSQKGNVMLQLRNIQSFSHLYPTNEQNYQSFDKEQASSSDSYDTNLKEANIIADIDSHYNKYPESQFSFENQRNADFSQQIILEEIDLQDLQHDLDNSKENFNLNLEQIDQIKKILPFHEVNQRNNQIQKNQQHQKIKERLLQQRFKIEKYLHNLQDSDFSMMKLEQRMKQFTL